VQSDDPPARRDRRPQSAATDLGQELAADQLLGTLSAGPANVQGILSRRLVARTIAL
jgi:hypothetical protein